MISIAILVVLFAVIGLIGWIWWPDANELVDEAASGDVAGVRRCLRFGVNPNAPSLWGWEHKNKGPTALTAASRTGRLDVVKYLLEHGAKINNRDGQGNTAVIEAAGSGNLALVQYLFDQGADLHISDINGSTALHPAASLGHIPVISFLLDLGMPINITDKFGNTPLMRACQTGNVEAVRYLLSRNADASIGGYRNTAIDIVRGHLAARQRDHDLYATKNNWSESEYLTAIEPYQQILELLSAPSRGE